MNSNNSDDFAEALADLVEVDGPPEVTAVALAETDAPDVSQAASISTYNSERLVAALDDPAIRDQAEAEIALRLDKTPIANRLSYRFVKMWSKKQIDYLTTEEENEFADALDGLVKCCFRAIGDRLWAPGYRGDDRRESTRRFVQDRVLALLDSYRFRPEREVLLCALHRSFKNLPAEIRCDLLDEIKRQYTGKGRAMTFLQLKRPDECLKLDEPNSGRAIDAIELIELRRCELVKSLGPQMYETLLAVVDSSQNDCGDSKQERKSQLTRAITKKCGVKTRRATGIKEEFYKKIHQALKAGDPVVSQIFDLLQAPPRNSYGHRQVCLDAEHDDTKAES